MDVLANTYAKSETMKRSQDKRVVRLVTYWLSQWCLHWISGGFAGEHGMQGITPLYTKDIVLNLAVTFSF